MFDAEELILSIIYIITDMNVSLVHICVVVYCTLYGVSYLNTCLYLSIISSLTL